jgi:predicted RNA-binding Zn-ribbon protein involved in translation (DUF1610 family)
MKENHLGGAVIGSRTLAVILSDALILAGERIAFLVGEVDAGRMRPQDFVVVPRALVAETAEKPAPRPRKAAPRKPEGVIPDEVEPFEPSPDDPIVVQEIKRLLDEGRRNRAESGEERPARSTSGVYPAKAKRGTGRPAAVAPPPSARVCPECGERNYRRLNVCGRLTYRCLSCDYVKGASR